MDVTTVNDRHLYRATVVVADPQTPTAQAELPDRIVRFGPPGWLTVMKSPADSGVVMLYPVCHVLMVSGLREVASTRPEPAKE